MGEVIDVGPWMGPIRRRARLVVLMEELLALESEEEVSEGIRERLRALGELARGL